MQITLHVFALQGGTLTKQIALHAPAEHSKPYRWLHFVIIAPLDTTARYQKVHLVSDAQLECLEINSKVRDASSVLVVRFKNG